MQFEFNSELWLYQGDGAWVFTTLPKNVSKDIKLVTSSLPKRVFGSVKVNVEVEDIKWKTSIFPDSKSRSYLLPIKQEVRKKASISVGDTCKFKLRIDDIL